MKQKLSQLTAPALAGVAKEKSTKAAIAEINNCIYDEADMIDIHLSCLENTDIDELRKIITFSKLPRAPYALFLPTFKKRGEFSRFCIAKRRRRPVRRAKISGSRAVFL